MSGQHSAHALTSAFHASAGERDAWSRFGRAARAVPSPMLHGMMAAALLCGLLPAMAKSLHAATWWAEPLPATVLLPATDASGPARARCPDCGVVESIRALAHVPGVPAAWEFNVRLRDGSLRTSTTDGTAAWRVGDRILLVGGPVAP